VAEFLLSLICSCNYAYKTCFRGNRNKINNNLVCKEPINKKRSEELVGLPPTGDGEIWQTIILHKRKEVPFSLLSRRYKHANGGSTHQPPVIQRRRKNILFK
jgi:hypothetical protein